MSYGGIDTKTIKKIKINSIPCNVLVSGSYSKNINLPPSCAFSNISFGVQLIKEAQMIIKRELRINSICNADV